MAHGPLTTDFIAENPKYMVWKNAMGFLSDNGGADYNLCHCASFLPSQTPYKERLLTTIATLGALL